MIFTLTNGMKVRGEQEFSLPAGELPELSTPSAALIIELDGPAGQFKILPPEQVEGFLENWGKGKTFASPVGEAPAWAMKLRGEWDDAYADVG